MTPDYFRLGPDRWVRIAGWQFGYHGEGRSRLFSERTGRRRGPLTIRVGRRAEVSVGRIRRLGAPR